ncbi:VCBS domain-containing protein [Colwellia echini]|uniref:F5/8 type C domain-containing protein n=1 Tax=Colwellia echini TaxID=1982103 RepID=A0ABY3MYZ6_9GAMM|nr:VCBS domain-containing protein [Colwellia echini]TYK66309.1 hypothetical protein CWS31_006865 [Colwellia echini]
MINKSLISIAIALSLTACDSDTDKTSIQDKAAQIIEDHGTVVLCPVKSELVFSGAIATAQQDANNSSNAIDGDIATRWSAESLPLETAVADEDGNFLAGSESRNGESLTIKLTEVSLVSELLLSWNKSDERTTSYSVSTSLDNNTWTEVLAETTSEDGNENGKFELIELEESVAQYIRVTGYGNSALSGWNSLDEAIVKGCTSEEVSIATNIAATFFGSDTGAIDSDDESIGGSLLISDLDGDTFVAQTDATGTGGFGTFSIDAAGIWIYTLADISAVTDIPEGETRTDTLTVESTDGEETTLTITITGAEVADNTGGGDTGGGDTGGGDTGGGDTGGGDTGGGDTGGGDTGGGDTGGNKVLQISDTQTFDAGELRYKHGTALSEGKLTASILIEAGKNKSAYIGIYGESTSTGNAVVDLNIGSSNIKSRDSVMTAVDYSADVWIPVELSWTTTEITVKIGDNPVETYAPTNTAGTYPIENFVFKLGDTSNTETANFLVDDIKIYDDAAGTSEVFSDNFETYTSGQSLDPFGNTADDDTNDVEDTSAADTYNSNSNEVVVIDDPTIEGGSDGGGDSVSENLQAAKISDTQTFDAGELRYKHGTALSEGKLTASILIEAGKNKSAYIGIYGESTSTGNAVVDLNIGSSNIKSRDSVMTAVDYSADVWIPVELSWTTTEITVKIGDNPVETYAPTNTAGTYPIENFVFKLGDTSNTETANFFIDDIKIYDDAAGTSEVFTDNFETYTAGQSLDPFGNAADDDTNDVEDTSAADTYNSNSNEVVAATRPVDVD